MWGTLYYSYYVSWVLILFRAGSQMNLPFCLGNSSKDLAMDLYVGVFMDFPQACIILKSIISHI